MSVDHTSEFVKQQTLTRDAFLGGRLIVSQPGNGFRAGLESVLLGSAIAGESISLLDLGAGAGTAALVALANGHALTATLVDADPEMTALAGLNLSQNGLADRARVLTLDVTAKGSDRAAAGLASDHYWTVIANPPFFDPGSGTAPAEARAPARHMDPESLELWVRTAAASAAPDGDIVFIHAASSLPSLLAAFDRRFGAIKVLPLCPREGEAANRVLIRGVKGSRAPLTLLASRALHQPSGQGFRPEFEAIFRGTGRLDW